MGEVTQLGSRAKVKECLAALDRRRTATGASLLIYHRVGGGTTNELDLTAESFRRQLDLLTDHDVISLDAALDRLEFDDLSPSVVLTFDDGFADVYENAWPLLRERAMPFTIYVATKYMGTAMQWEGATATGPAGRGLTWEQLKEMVESGLCTIGNHTHSHARPEHLTEGELDACTAILKERLGVTPRHFTYPWGIVVPTIETALRERFRSASTGELGRNLPGVNPMRLRRIPVRRSDPEEFFAAKLRGGLAAERAYAWMVRAAKAVGSQS